MRTIYLAAIMTVAPMTFLGCTENADKRQQDGSAQHTDFEPDGSWLFLGPSDGPHTLKISNDSMVYADIDGQWTSTWTIKAYDNDLRHFQIVFKSGTGTYLPVGQSMSGTYAMTQAILTVQLSEGLGSYPTMESPGSCMDGAAAIPDCRLYVGQN